MTGTIHFLHDQAWANARGIDDALRQIAAETPEQINAALAAFYQERIMRDIPIRAANQPLTPDAPMVTDATADNPEGPGFFGPVLCFFALIGLFSVAFFVGKAVMNVALAMGWV